MANFRKTLKEGRKGEEALARLLKAAGISCVSHAGLTHDLSCRFEELAFTVEVKFDQMEATTGNIAIEYYNTKLFKPSGIAATKANLWCVVLQKPETIWLCDTEFLREYAETVMPLRVITNAGDGNAALKLYKRDIILSEVFLRVDGLSPIRLLETIRGLLCTT